MLRNCLFLLWMFAVTYDISVAQERYYCRITDMPTFWKTDGQPGKVVASQAVFTDLGTAEPSIDIRNTQPASITNLAIVIEYLDKEGNTVSRAVIAGAAPGLEKAMPTPFPVENIETWKRPLDPREIARVQGISNGNRTITCPVSARITFAMARFQNGEIRRYSSAGWGVSPLPRLVPRLESACPLLEREIIEVPAKLRISNVGDVVGVSTASSAHVEAFSWAATRLKDWKFHSALVDGQPRESELRVEFIFYGSTDQDLSAISPSLPAVLIRFVPSSEASSPRCFEAFASLSEGSAIP